MTLLEYVQQYQEATSCDDATMLDMICTLFDNEENAMLVLEAFPLSDA